MAKIIPELIQKYHHPRFKILVGDLTIYDTEFVSNSFSYRTGTGSGEFSPGGCVIASCSFALNNDDGRYNTTFDNNAPVMVYIGYGRTADTATYDILCCVFAAEIKKKKSIISVTCYDKLRQADKVKWTTYSFPMTVNQIITAAATQAGIGVQSLPPAGGDISVDLRDENGNQPDLNLTCRQALSSATLIAGCYGYVSYDSLFVCGWYNKLADTTVDANWMFDYEINDPLDYTGVQVFGQEVKGDATRLYKLSDGDFITEANCAAIQDRLYDALVGLPVRQATIKMVCNPNIRPGMSVMLAYNQGGQDIVATIPITSMTIKSGMSAEYVCETISPDEADDLRKDDESSGSTGSIGGGQYGGAMQRIYIPPSDVIINKHQYAISNEVIHFCEDLLPEINGTLRTYTWSDSAAKPSYPARVPISTYTETAKRAYIVRLKFRESYNMIPVFNATDDMRRTYCYMPLRMPIDLALLFEDDLNAGYTVSTYSGVATLWVELGHDSVRRRLMCVQAIDASIRIQFTLNMTEGSRSVSYWQGSLHTTFALSKWSETILGNGVPSNDGDTTLGPVYYRDAEDSSLPFPRKIVQLQLMEQPNNEWIWNLTERMENWA